MTSDELRAAVEEHIRTLVGRYKGRVFSWDVVNEAIADFPVGLRNSIFLQKLGPEYIADAFRLTHEVDPEALLFYNDYSVEVQNAKSDFMYEMVRGFLESGVPIHGVGLQTHLGPYSTLPNLAQLKSAVKSNLQRFADLGLLVSLSEMDVQIRNLPGTLEQRLEAQRDIYREVVEACVEVAGCYAIQFWGVTDKYSWIKLSLGFDDMPLLFDDNYEPKPAYFGVGEALDPDFPPCADGVLDEGEQCDDGNFDDGDGCDSTCTVTGCGNGILTAGEECDDGNVVDGDDCSSVCQCEGEGVPGTVAIVKPGKLFKLVGKGSFGLPELAGEDPTALGGILSLLDTGAGAGVDLELAEGTWQILGDPAAPKGFKYQGSGTGEDPCSLVLVKPALVKAVCKGPAVTLPLPVQDELRVVLRIGKGRYCAQFGGNRVANRAELFKATDARAADCCADASSNSD